MDTTPAYPGRLGEAEFLEAYATQALRKPQVVADNVLTGIFLTDVRYRGALTALLVQEAVEAARRLAAVWLALTDRSRPVARALAGPLPGADQWEEFARAVEEATAAEQPGALLRMMAIDHSALQSAEELCAFQGLARFATPIRVYEPGPPTVTASGGVPGTLLLSNATAEGTVETRMTLADAQIIALGDATGDFTTWAGDFLGAYLEGRS